MNHCSPWVNLQFQSRDDQQEELEQEIGELEIEAERVKVEIVELVGDVPF